MEGYIPVSRVDDEQSGGSKVSKRQAISTVGSGPDEDIVQFMESVVVVDGDSGEVEVSIMRIGPCEQACSFTWKTIAGSALPGKQYVESNGTIEMKCDESEASIKVPMLGDALWNATKEFKIVLENNVGCVLGLYLKEVRVKVMDSDKFPSNVFAEQISGELESADGLVLKNINMFVLFLEFVKLMKQQPGVGWRTFLTILFGLLRNLYDYLSLILSIYMVDTVFNLNKDSGLIIPSSRLQTAYCVALLLFLPELVFYCLHRVQVHMDISGLLQKELSQSLFRKFMNYSTNSKDKCPLPTMISAVVDDVGDVSFGYKRTLEIIHLFGQIVTAVYFTLSKNPQVWWAMIVVPTLMIAYGKCRLQGFIGAAENADEKRDAIAAFVNETLSKMTLISAYKQRPQINEIFEEKAADLKNAVRPKKANELINMLVPEMTGPALVAVYTIIGAGHVLNKSLGLGTYLATIKVFASICKDFSSLYSQAMSIVGTFPALKSLTILLNMPTDLPDVMNCCHQQSKITKEKRSKMEAAKTPRADRLDIELRGVSFHHPGSEPLFQSISYETKQGRIIGIDAQSGKGRRTLLELLAGTIYPSSGELFIPSHLRVLLVSREVFLLNLPLWANLTFGNRKSNDPYRVEKILQHFELNRVLDDPQFKTDMAARKKEHSALNNGPEEEIEDAEAEVVEETVNKLESLRESEKALIHLCRGFIMNPEILLVHRPFVHFHDDDAMDKTREAFEEHRNNRGFMLKPDTILQRRPRTIFITPDFSRSQKGWVDEIWHLPDAFTKQYSGKDHHCMQYTPGSDVDHALEEIRGKRHTEAAAHFSQAQTGKPATSMQPDFMTNPQQPYQQYQQPLAPLNYDRSLMDIFDTQVSKVAPPVYSKWPVNAIGLNRWDL